MPLTGAERARKFREKLKEDPEKYERYKQKQREIVGKNRKKIADLNYKDRIKQRAQWRKQKRNQKERKEASRNQETIPTNKIKKKSSKVNMKLKWVNPNYKLQKKIQKLKTVTGHLRKQLVLFKQKIKDLETTKSKTEKDLENLKDAVKETYSDCTTLRDKRLLKKVALKASQKSGSNLLILPKMFSRGSDTIRESL